MKTPTNRITGHWSRELEPVNAAELQAAIEARQREQQQAWQVAYQRGSEDGYACGWVQAAGFFVLVSAVLAAWRAW